MLILCIICGKNVAADTKIDGFDWIKVEVNIIIILKPQLGSWIFWQLKYLID